LPGPGISLGRAALAVPAVASDNATSALAAMVTATVRFIMVITGTSWSNADIASDQPGRAARRGAAHHREVTPAIAAGRFL
jgi:hypothetical protein